MKRVAILVFGFLITGCVSPSTVLVSENGKAYRCATTGGGYGIMGAVAVGMAQSSHDKCVEDAKKIGYVILPDAFLGVKPKDWNSSPLTITAVAKGSPAEQAGIREGDIITMIDDEPTVNYRQSLDRLATKLPGGAIKVTLQRGGQVMEVRPVLAKRSDNIAALMELKAAEKAKAQQQ